jgi:hypothetical protein
LAEKIPMTLMMIRAIPIMTKQDSAKA